jgi:hypothetical protein
VTQDISAIDIGKEGSGNWDGSESHTIMAVMTREIGHMTSTLGSQPEQPGRLAARLLADDPDIRPRHFDDVMSTGKQCCLTVSICHMLKIDLKH